MKNLVSFFSLLLFVRVTKLCGQTLTKQQGSFLNMGIYMIMLLFGIGASAFSQKKFSVQPGLAFGSTMSNEENANQKGRIMIGFNAYYNLTQQLSFGVELSTAGSFINSVGGSANQDEFDPTTNTIYKDVSNMKSNTVLGKVKYYFITNKKSIKPFVEFGLGAVTYYEKIFNISGESERKIKQSSMAYQPGIGIAFNHFEIAVLYQLGGKTPDFAGVDDSGSAANVQYESIHISPLFVNFSWRFDF